MGVSQFAKGQGVVLMPLQSEYEFQDCEPGEPKRDIENTITDSKGMLYHSSKPSADSNTTFNSYIFCSIIISLSPPSIDFFTKRYTSRSACNSLPCFTTYISISVFGQRPDHLLQLCFTLPCSTTLSPKRITNHRRRAKSYLEKTRDPIRCNACSRPRRY